MENMSNTNQNRFSPITRRNETIRQENLAGERALYRGENLEIYDTVFHDGESPLKESKNIKLFNSEFQYKYPLWYSNNVTVKDSVWQEMGRSGVWYTNHLIVEDSMIWAPKNFRRCQDVTLRNVTFADAKETFWMCKNVILDHVTAKGDYFGMNCENVDLGHVELYGNYAFDGAKNVTARNCKFLTKDCFWNCENVTVYDSYISGEYLAWNTKNLTLINCTIASEQGLDYIDGLKMVNCKMVNTRYAFEYSTNMDVEIVNHVDSILNPGQGKMVVKSIGEKIIEPDNCDISKTEIVEG